MKTKQISLTEKGITLVALVITVIIMLILAGVTLNIAIGDNGLFNMVRSAVNVYGKKAKEEDNNLKELEQQLGNLITTNPDGQTPTPPSGETGIADNLKDYIGKFVDIGIDIDGKEDTKNDWEIFYATNDRIFLIAADYVPSSKLREWKVIGDGSTLGSIGFKDAGDSHKYGVYWPEYPTKFLDLPQEPDNFLNLVMHSGYDLNANKEKVNSMAASYFN